MRFSLALGAAAALRVGMLAWGAYQDAHSPVPYTDVDYFVFSDAAHCLVHPLAANCAPAKGPWATASIGDPYARATYRYTPLLALLLAPTSFLHPAFGKVLFAACDLLVGVLLYRLCRRRGDPPSKAANAVAAVWLLNPIIANISTRGSSEAVVGLVVVSALYWAEAGRWDVAAVAYGLAVHLKIFPFIYVSSVVAALFRFNDLKRSILRIIRFGFISFSSFMLLNTAMYAIWGQPFLSETFLYHLGRLDHRHNFSPYFYPFYLSGSPSSSLPSLPATLLQQVARHPLAAFLPQVGLTLGLGVLFGPLDLPFAWLVQTFAFVALNKVCTSQYFLWFLWLLPPCLSRLRLSFRLAAITGALWVLGQALWLSQAYQLEFVGASKHKDVWLAGVVFLVVQGWVLHVLLSSFSPRPLSAAAGAGRAK